MSFTAIFFILGWVMSAFGLAMLVPAAAAWWYNDPDILAFLHSGLGTTFLGVTFVLMNRSSDRYLSHRDGFFLTLAIWLSLSFIGALPLYFSGAAPTMVDAFFEAVSGLTTTGASVLSGLDDMGHGVLLWRSMLQWLGGMGIIVLMVAILPFLGVGGLQLYRSEMPGVVADKLQPRLKETAKLLWMVYLLFTVLCAMSYSLAGMSTFDAITHSFTTTATGGFSTHDASFAHFDSFLIEVIAVFFMMVGAVNYSLHYLFLAGRGTAVYLKNPEFKFFVSIVSLAVILITATLFATGWYNGVDAFRYALFNTVSVVTTTGFATTDFNIWPVMAPLMMLALMFFGGCTGSTAGGMKVLRIMMITRQGGRELSRLVHPRGVVHVKIGKRSVPDHIMQAVWSFAGLYILCFILIAMAISSYGIDLVTSFSAAGAALTGLGPGLGEVGPASNYGGLPQGVKMLLCAAMLLGRLEIFTILVIFTPGFWRK